jgi:hypothetical protein
MYKYMMETYPHYNPNITYKKNTYLSKKLLLMYINKGYVDTLMMRLSLNVPFATNGTYGHYHG